MSPSMADTGLYTPSSNPAKRTSTSAGDLERPIKRLHLSSNAPSGGSNSAMTDLQTIPSERMNGMDAPLITHDAAVHVTYSKGQGRAVSEGMDLDGDGLIPPPKKWKGKGKMKVCPLLPDDIWRRVFEFLFDSYRQDWHREVPNTNTLDALLISKELSSIVSSILYSHPHIHYDAIPRFIQSFSRSSESDPKDTRLAHLRDVTIRPSPTYFALSVGETATLHPRLGELFTVLPDRLNSLTLRDTLIIDNDDRDQLFKALKLVRPRKARLEIRFWDLSQSPIGRDLLAATRPGPYFTTSASFRRPANGEDDDSTPPIIVRPHQDPGSRTFQELWRGAMIMREELEIPMRWLEDEREVQAQAQAAQAAQAAQQVGQPPGLLQAQMQIAQLTQQLNAPVAGPQAAAAPGTNNLPPGGHTGFGISLRGRGTGREGAISVRSSRNVLPPSSQLLRFPGETYAGINWHNPSTSSTSLAQRTDTLRRANAARMARVRNEVSQTTETESMVAEGSSSRLEGTTESTSEATTTVGEDAPANAESIPAGEVMAVDSNVATLSNVEGPIIETTQNVTQEVDVPGEAVKSETLDLATSAPPETVVPTPTAPGASESNTDTMRYNLRPRETQGTAATAPPDTTTEPTAPAAPASQSGDPAKDTIGYPVRDEDRDRVSDPRAWLERFSKRTEGQETKPGFKWIPREEVAESTPKSWFISPQPDAEQTGPVISAESSVPVEQTEIKGKGAESSEEVKMENDTPAAGQSLDRIETPDAGESSSDAMVPSENALEAPVTSPIDPARLKLPKRYRAYLAPEPSPEPSGAVDVDNSIESVQDGPNQENDPPAVSTPDWPGDNESTTDVEDEDMQEALYQSRVDNLAPNTNLLSFASSSASTATVPPPNTTSIRYTHLNGMPGSSFATIHVNNPNNIAVTAPQRFPSSYLPHTFREALFELFDQYWCPNIQAFSFVALDPHASVIVQAPRLDFWNRVEIPRIRVHLPRCINSLAVFKGLKENRRDRRRRQRLLAAPGQAADTAVPSDDHIIVGGDGEGGDLVHESNRLFEIEVNTEEEMDDVVWIHGGDQLPPQVCRILAGSHDWNDVPVDFLEPSPTRPNQPILYTPSPATSQFASPTFSWADDSGDEAMSEFNLDTRTDAGANYDAEAARAQLHRQKSKLAQVEDAEDLEMENQDD